MNDDNTIQDRILLSNAKQTLYSKKNWIPLRKYHSKNQQITPINHKNFYSFYSYLTLAVKLNQKNFCETSLDWSTMSSFYSQPYFNNNQEYIPTYEYWNNNELIGYWLVTQDDLVFEMFGKRVWTINQDLILALKLIKKQISKTTIHWICPKEAFIDVIHEILDEDGNHTCIEIRKEFLMDYLAARKLNLRLFRYYDYEFTSPSRISDSVITKQIGIHKINNGEFSLHETSSNDNIEIHGVVVRNNSHKYKYEDAPRIDFSDDTTVENFIAQPKIPTTSSSYDYYSQLYIDEWIEHNNISTKIRDDDPTTIEYIVDVNGKKLNQNQLKNPNIISWLNFSPNVIEEILNLNRTLELNWISKYTAILKCPAYFRLEIGFNEKGTINVLASDIAQLPIAYQKIWARNNLIPDCSPANELCCRQLNQIKSKSVAPEQQLFECLHAFEKKFKEKFGLSPYNSKFLLPTKITINRFQAKDLKSLLALSTNLHKFYIERLDSRALKEGLISMNISKKEIEKLGSLKLLEKLVQQFDNNAHTLCSNLFYIYDIRNCDAHCSSNTDRVLARAEINTEESMLLAGMTMIEKYSQSMLAICNAIK